jgi:predicted transcriptional regulator
MVIEGIVLGYRRKLDIIADMLLVARGGAKKTQIMYQANLSYRLLMKYLDEVKKAYLLSFERKRRCYVLTSKGREFLETYKEYSRRNRCVERSLNEVDDKRRVLEQMCRRGGVGADGG